MRSLSLANWTAAYHWAVKDSKVLQRDGNENRISIFYTASLDSKRGISKKLYFEKNLLPLKSLKSIHTVFGRYILIPKMKKIQTAPAPSF
jgi:hypothetical protein